MLTCEDKKHQLLLSLPLCCVVAGKASQSTLPCPPVDSGRPTPPTSPAPRLPIPGTVVDGLEQARPNRSKSSNTLHHRLLFTARSECLSREFSALSSQPTNAPLLCQL